MAMSGATLSAAIRADLLANDPNVQDNDSLQKLCDAIANSVVNHITANAVVNVTSVSGVQTGGGVSGPGTGTIA